MNCKAQHHFTSETFIKYLLEVAKWLSDNELKKFPIVKISQNIKFSYKHNNCLSES